MIKRPKLPTLLGILILTIGLIASIILIQKTQLFKIGANEVATPKNVRFTNLTDNSMTVTWTTDIESVGFVKWGSSKAQLSKVSEEEKGFKGFVHSININGIDLNSDVFVKINSNGIDYDNNGTIWQSKTNSNATENSKKGLLASGIVLKNDTVTPARALVYLTINGILLSGITSAEGSYIIPISNVIENIPESTTIEVSVNDGQKNIAQAVIYPQAVSSIPTIILGKTYDFRTLKLTEDSSVPKSSLTIPESVEISSRFEIVRSLPEQAGDVDVNIESINEGEIINTTDPEFFGSAPKDTELEILVESELQTETITANKNGDWKWSPPNNLETGEHKVTLKWKDASGILRTLTRTFVVQAAEGPAFVSTPSATLVSTPTATAKATTVPTPTQSEPVATLAPTPETGSLTPTIGLFIMGIGVLMSSIFVYKKQDA